MHSVAEAQAVIGEDTRESSRWIADRIAEGRPPLAWMSTAKAYHHSRCRLSPRSRKTAAGVVVSASHNPWTDNGIKVFSGDGFKLSDARELAIEKGSSRF